MQLTNLCSLSFGKDQLAIALSHSPMGAGHIGIAFHSAKEGPQVLHLAWHVKLQTDAIPDELKTCWAAFILPLPPMASKQVVALTRVIAKRQARIAYGIDFQASENSFSANGAYSPPKGSNGLTCASFVLEVLRRGSVDLIKSSSWRANPLNVEWGQQVCDLLSQTAPPEHVEAVKRDISGIRLRPAEVAGAAALGANQWPADFDQVQEPASQVWNALNTVCPPPMQRGDVLPLPPAT
jgi:hypothetical protein